MYLKLSDKKFKLEFAGKKEVKGKAVVSFAIGNGGKYVRGAVALYHSRKGQAGQYLNAVLKATGRFGDYYYVARDVFTLARLRHNERYSPAKNYALVF